MAASSHAMRAGKSTLAQVMAKLRWPIPMPHVRNSSTKSVSNLSRPAAAQQAQQPPKQRSLHRHKPAAKASRDTRLSAIVASSERAHPDKPKGKDGKPRGEDACFHTSGTGATGGKWTVCGIADGVGGWSSEGIDAGEYARELMSHAKAASSSDALRAEPKKLLGTAHEKMSPSTQGSCTAVIAVLENDVLRLANLGDSGVIGYRAHQSFPFLRTKEQQHRFNCPLQLGSGGGGDVADDANVEEIRVQPNDIVVLATDGFYDNLYDRDILALIRNFIAQDEQHSMLLMPTVNTTRHATTTAAGVQASAASIISASASASTSAVPSVAMPEELADGQSTSRAFPGAPTMQAAGPAEKHFLSSRGLSNLASLVSAAVIPETPPPSAHSLSHQSLQRLAENLVQEAQKKAMGTASTPFSEAAARARKRYQGGKLDDITVIVVQMQSQENDSISTASTSAM